MGQTRRAGGRGAGCLSLCGEAELVGGCPGVWIQKGEAERAPPSGRTRSGPTIKPLLPAQQFMCSHAAETGDLTDWDAADRFQRDQRIAHPRPKRRPAALALRWTARPHFLQGDNEHAGDGGAVRSVLRFNRFAPRAAAVDAGIEVAVPRRIASSARILSVTRTTPVRPRLSRPLPSRPCPRDRSAGAAG
jgi:hypothetical protein